MVSCAICHTKCSDARRDQVIPKFKGGTWVAKNTHLVCRACKEQKTAEELREYYSAPKSIEYTLAQFWAYIRESSPLDLKLVKYYQDHLDQEPHQLIRLMMEVQNLQSELVKVRRRCEQAEHKVRELEHDMQVRASH